VALSTAAVLALTACAGSPDPSPTTTSSPTSTAVADPTSLGELERAVIDEGLVDSASFQVDIGQGSTLTIQLFWDDVPSAADQLAAITEVDRRIDELPDRRPEQTQIVLSTNRADGGFFGIQTGYDPGTEVLAGMLEAVDGTACHSANLARRDTGDGSGERAILDLRCSVEAKDVVGLAGSYDEVTGLGTGIAGVDATTWEVSIQRRSTSEALLRLDAGPIDGRQQVLVDAMTTAVGAGAARLTVIDSGTSVVVAGFADAGQSGLCTTLVDQMTAAGVERASARMQLRDAQDWACNVNP